MADGFFISAASNAVGTLMIDYLVKPIERRIRYLFCFRSIVEDEELHRQQRKLTTEQRRLQEDVKKAKLQIQTQVIEDSVDKWLTETEDALKDVRSLDERIEENKRCFRLCPDWCWRYQLSKEIKKRTKVHRTVCEHMECQAIVPIDILDGDEAWALFKMKANLDERVSRDIVEEAKKVAEECKGLPVAIVTLARALKGTKTRKEWELALKKLESSRLIEIGNIEEELDQENDADRKNNAYWCIKMSYDYLKKETTKRCFLFCALYPEDHSIDVEDLLQYAWALELYDKVDSVEDVRTEVLLAIDYLKDSCLLLKLEMKMSEGMTLL
ncbi:hypothetical protein V6N13_117517 [Hibiscus sabdariffa]